MRRLLSGLLFLLLMALTTVAQESVDTEFSGIFTVTVPEAWDVKQITGEGYYWTTDDSILRIRQYSPAVQELFEINDLEAFLEYLVTEAFDMPDFDDDVVSEVSLGDYEGLSYSFEQTEEGNTFTRTVFAYQMEEGFVIAGNIRPQEGGEPNEDELAELQTALPTVQLGDVFNFYEGTVLEIPDDWELTHLTNTVYARIYAKNEGVQMQLILWPGYAAIAGIENVRDFLPWAYDKDNYELIERFDPDKMQALSIAGVDAQRYDFEPESLNENQSYDRALLVFELPNNSAFTAFVTSENPDDSIDNVIDLLDTLVAGRQFVCPLFADPGIRIRSEPDTNSELVRQTDEETLVAFNTTSDDSGNTWFNVGEGYIRSDVIYYEQNPCDDIPEGR
jgi:hypothetical protein